MVELRKDNRRIRITASPLIELMHVLHVLGRERSIEIPWRDDLKAKRPDLVEEVKRLWADTHRAMSRGMELFWIAASTGYIETTDLEHFFARFSQLVEQAWEAWTPGAFDRDAPDFGAEGTQRLKLLRDPQFQTKYLALLRELWAELEHLWEQDGLPLIVVESTRLQQRLQEGEDLVDILPPKNFLTLEEYAGYLTDRDGRDLIVTPLHFSRGGYLIDTKIEGLPLFIGYGLSTEGMHRATHDAASQLAGKLKAFADPTRLTLLATIVAIEVTVGDLAKLLEITQPSVSGHLRVLESAGLVTVRRKGAKAFYRANKGAIEALLGEANALLS